MRHRPWLGFALLLLLPARASIASELMMRLDANRDGTVNLSDVKAAANAAFDRFDASAGAARFSSDTRALFRRNYIALATKRFKAADLDHDGTLDEQELEAPAGVKLTGLLDEQ